MLIKLLILVILLVALLYIYYKRYLQVEQFVSCPIDQPPNSIYRPIKMILSDIDKFNISGNQDYVEPNILLTIDELKTILNSIDKNRPMYIYREIETPSYNYTKTYHKEVLDSSVSVSIDKLNEVLKNYIDIAIKNKGKCVDNNCYTVTKDYRVIRVAKSENGTQMVEGQLLYSFHSRPIDFLVKYVISTENRLTIHSLELEGYEFSSNKESIDLREPNLQLYRNPMIHTYNNGSDYNDSIVPSKTDIDAILTRRELELKHDEKCYGKIALNKNECETEIDIYGKPLSVVGVWDSDCLNDYECPFFKANKNYPNTFGKCLQGKCQMPLGITQVSSKKYRNLDGAICSNCKLGNNCCVDQRKQYSKLVSPDYRFDGDMEERNRHSLSFTTKGLKVI